jgi:hypothetical protein
LFANVPLSDEAWKLLEERDVVAASAGELIAATMRQGSSPPSGFCRTAEQVEPHWLLKDIVAGFAASDFEPTANLVGFDHFSANVDVRPPSHTGDERLEVRVPWKLAIAV